MEKIKRKPGPKVKPQDESARKVGISVPAEMGRFLDFVGDGTSKYFQERIATDKRYIEWLKSVDSDQV
jgi:hypothetical protein